MSNQRKSEAILEFHRRAVAARRFAAACHDPAERADLLEVARRWQMLSDYGGASAPRELEKKVLLQRGTTFGAVALQVGLHSLATRRGQVARVGTSSPTSSCTEPQPFRTRGRGLHSK